MERRPEDAKPSGGRALHAHHRERLRTRLMQFGSEALSEHEIIEVLLYSTIRRQNTNETAHRLVDRYGSARGALETPADELARVKGVGELSAEFLHNVGRAVAAYADSAIRPRRTARSPSAAFEFAREFFDENPEAEAVFIAMDDGMGIKNANAIPRHPKMSDLIGAAIEQDAYRVIVAFREPSDEPIGWGEVADGFDLMRSMLAFVRAALLDCIILGDEPRSLYQKRLPRAKRYLKPQELDGAVLFHSEMERAALCCNYAAADRLESGDETEPERAVPAFRLNVSERSCPSPEGESAKIVSRARVRADDFRRISAELFDGELTPEEFSEMVAGLPWELELDEERLEGLRRGSPRARSEDGRGGARRRVRRPRRLVVSDGRAALGERRSARRKKGGRRAKKYVDKGKRKWYN